MKQKIMCDPLRWRVNFEDRLQTLVAWQRNTVCEQSHPIILSVFVNFINILKAPKHLYMSSKTSYLSELRPNLNQSTESTDVTVA